MKTTFLTITSLVASFTMGWLVHSVTNAPLTSSPIDSTTNNNLDHMKLGAFSVSLSVKDLQTSKTFYEQLGFNVLAGSMDKNYLIMKNEQTLIGLFQGMFEGNILTFNPGWDQNAAHVDPFDDIRDIQKQLKNSGLTLTSEVDEATEGPANLVLTDPDGNVILIDQHR